MYVSPRAGTYVDPDQEKKKRKKKYFQSKQMPSSIISYVYYIAHI